MVLIGMLKASYSCSVALAVWFRFANLANELAGRQISPFKLWQ
jgi:hypothetical protein